MTWFTVKVFDEKDNRISYYYVRTDCYNDAARYAFDKIPAGHTLLRLEIKETRI